MFYLKNRLWSYKIKITAQSNSDGAKWFVVEVPAIKDCISIGMTRKGAVTNAIKAIEEYISNKNKTEDGETVEKG